ncbi:hypothetical protein RND81_07G149400 [Saponaria officinalis]|uniref:Homeobox domain-containing protein n=1 Tax=Saponaria officinalis TaxID=3572 RepID=A0AAW1JSC6_SAPOF
MASSNKHWPSMFKSKPCNNPQWSEHNVNSRARSSGCEERSPEPKPRWNPKPEQIRILESIFNSGLVNPPRDEIRRIRIQLQEYGQVGDANVFYWFQNRKSRSKNKQRTPHSKTTATSTVTTATSTVTATATSSDKNTPMIMSESGNNSLNNNNIYNTSNNFDGEQFIGNFSQGLYNNNNIYNNILGGPNFVGNNNFNQNLCYENTTNISTTNNNNNSHRNDLMNNHETISGFSSLLFGGMFYDGGCVDQLKLQPELSCWASTPSICTISSSSGTTSTGRILGEADEVVGKLTIYINGMAIEVPNSPLNLKEEFGEDVMLVNAATGQQVVTNEWGVTLHALQHGASYYLVGVTEIIDGEANQ